MRRTRFVTLFTAVLVIAAACASTSRTGQSGLFRIELQRLNRSDGRAGVQVVVRNDSPDPAEVLDFGVRPEAEGAAPFESLSSTGPFQLAPGQEATSSFALPAGAALPSRVSVDVTWRRGGGPMERRSFWADLP